MGWETRERGGRYYTQSYREAGQVRRRYLGTGGKAVVLAALDASRQEATARRLALRQQEYARQDRLVCQLDGYYQAVEAGMRTCLERAGWHQHKRGEWRKRRMPQEEQAVERLPVSDKEREERAMETLGELIQAAEEGDKEAMQSLKGLLAIFPPDAQAVLYQHLGSASRVVREAYANHALGQRLFTKDAMLHQADQLEHDLAGPNASPLERTLCERIATCWLACHLAETMEDIGRQDALNKRYLSAILALARVRNLQTITPILAQVNIRQVPSDPNTARLMPGESE